MAIYNSTLETVKTFVYFLSKEICVCKHIKTCLCPTENSAGVRCVKFWLYALASLLSIYADRLESANYARLTSI